MNNRRSSNTDSPTASGTIITDTTSCWLDETGIAIFIAEGEQTVEHAKKNMAAYWQLTNGKKSPVLLDFTNIKSISREAREYYTSEESSSTVLGVAIVTNSIFGKVIGNFFMGLNFNKKGAPVKMFNNIDDAKKWLRHLI